jgi:uncharacterized protein YjiS (DUF1127 family)
MLMSLIHGYVRAYELRRSMGWMLQRADDRLLDDMGLTRDDLKQLVENGGRATKRSSARRVGGFATA